MKKPKQFTDAYLETFNLVSTGGRASYYYLHYCLIRSYLESHPTWPVIQGACGQFRKNHASWNYLIPKNVSFSKYLELYTQDATLLPRLREYITKISSEAIRGVQSKKLDTLATDELKTLIIDSCNRLSKTIYTADVLRVVDTAVLEYFSHNFKDNPKHAEIVQLASIPEEQSYSLREELALFDLAAKVASGEIKRGDDTYNRSLRQIVAQFTWTTMGYYNERPKDVETYEHKITDLLSSKDYEQTSNILARQKADFDKRNAMLTTLTADQKVVANIAAASASMKDYYKFSVNQVIYTYEALFVEVAKRLGQSVEWVKNLQPDEMCVALDGGTIDMDLVAKRADHSILLSFPEYLTEIVGDGAYTFEKKYLKLEEKNITEFKGRVACTGSASGIVKVIRNTSEFGKLQKGNILVVGNTSPDFVPILNKAGAILAEEGGLTAHVSVVSREFDIPCIVGLKRITEILKDGDVVEVDAEKGTVRKIN